MRTILKILTAGTIALSTLTFAYPMYAKDRPQITIDEHPGGMTDTQQRWMRFIVGSGASLRFIGMCLSSCTLGLGTPYACVEPTASFGFHLFSIGNTFALDLTLAWYRRWAPKLVPILAEMKLTPMVQYLSAAELVEKGVVEWCKHDYTPAADDPDFDEDDPEFILKDASHAR